MLKDRMRFTLRSGEKLTNITKSKNGLNNYLSNKAAVRVGNIFFITSTNCNVGCNCTYNQNEL